MPSARFKSYVRDWFCSQAPWDVFDKRWSANVKKTKAEIHLHTITSPTFIDVNIGTRQCAPGEPRKRESVRSETHTIRRQKPAHNLYEFSIALFETGHYFLGSNHFSPCLLWCHFLDRNKLYVNWLVFGWIGRGQIDRCVSRTNEIRRGEHSRCPICDKCEYHDSVLMTLTLR